MSKVGTPWEESDYVKNSCGRGRGRGQRLRGEGLWGGETQEEARGVGGGGTRSHKLPLPQLGYCVREGVGYARLVLPAECLRTDLSCIVSLSALGYWMSHFHVCKVCSKVKAFSVRIVGGSVKMGDFT